MQKETGDGQALCRYYSPSLLNPTTSGPNSPLQITALWW